MREKLIQYVSLLFEGTVDTEDIRQEILQNTLDKYDDLIAQGKNPEAAYRLSISGIGDISEILGQSSAAPETPVAVQPAVAEPKSVVEDDDEEEENTPNRKLRKAIDSIIGAVGLALYFLISFTTHAWHITWVIFLIIAAANGLVNAIFDLREACRK